MENDHEKWYFNKEQLEDTPSRRCGIESHQELLYRQEAANYIRIVGQKLKLKQLCINTATMYMHRFYMVHSFTQFQWTTISAASISVAAKVAEEHRSLNSIVWAANSPETTFNETYGVTSKRYHVELNELLYDQDVLIPTLGFNFDVELPHPHILLYCQGRGMSKELVAASYVTAHNCLRLTTLAIEYKPTVVACLCIYHACKVFNKETVLGNEKKEWFSCVDKTVTPELLEELRERGLVSR